VKSLKKRISLGLICSSHSRQLKNKTVYNERSFIMGRNVKYKREFKMKVVREYLDGLESANQLGVKYNCHKRTIFVWIAEYEHYGETAFALKRKNNSYTPDFKRMVVEEYLASKKSLQDLCFKYKIPRHKQLSDWIKVYNGHEKLKSYKASGGIIMIKGRKTTYEERITIVEHCIKNGLDYNSTTKKYEVPYQQIYSWVSKFNANGISALKDNRGKGKDKEDMNEVESLRNENKLLRAKLDYLKMEQELKKKVQEMQMDLVSTTRKKK